MARTLDDWFAVYAVSHRHPVNVALHRVCVPLITAGVFGLLKAISVFGAELSTVAAAAVVTLCVRLSPRLAIGAAVALATMLLGLWAMASAGLPVTAIAAGAFVVGWIGQFVGHAIEGERPSFFEDLQFLAIGPLWVLAGLYRRLGIPYA